MDFKIHSEFSPGGDQPKAIEQLVKGIKNNEKSQVLLGVTGSGKTFTMANVIKKIHKPTLIISHNKTLAAQLYGELKSFFPNNCVEYFISYYDYYQPEAYIPSSNVYIEKDLSINEQIEKLRLSATSSLLSGRNDVIVVASVSCIYGIGNPDDFGKNVLEIGVGQNILLKELLFSLVDILYERSHESDFKRGTFRLKGDTLDVYLAYADYILRIIFWGDEVESIQKVDPSTGRSISTEDSIKIYPANLFVTSKDIIDKALSEIENDLEKQILFFEKERKFQEAKRIKERTEFDIEMINEIGYCSGVENYSRYFDRRKPGKRPFCLIDYFPDDFMLFIDESHVTIPQIRAMWGGDRSRKMNLVDYGFRLPSALDNRPLNFQEFESLINKVVFVGATPSDYELTSSGGSIVEQIIRPTGLLDPPIEVRKTENQIDDIINEIFKRVEKSERVLITTLTKRMSEELNKYLNNSGIRARYIHSSHSSPRALTPGFERNVSDEMIKLISKNKGVILVNFGSSFVNINSNILFNEINLEVEKWRLENKYKISESQVLEYKESLIKDKNPFADINDVLDAIDHINNLVGIEHIGFGSDFDGLGNTLPTKLKNASNYPNLIEGLLNRNYSKDSIEKICYKNLFRV